jgi:protein-S-isoprenylcysteine O-methyltransferase Ste14
MHMKRLQRWALAAVVIGGTVFALAGTWTDPWLWAYLAVSSGVFLYGLLSIDDDLARERFSPPAPGADRLSLRTIRLVALAHLVVGALDSGRFHWTTVSAPLRTIGLIGFGASFLLIVRAMRANHFFSAVVRVQSDRGHRVVDQGPYAIVRHPGYAGMIPAVPFSGLALGSWLAVGLALIYSALIVRRVMFEDRFLHQNLDGYRDYATRVKHRLVPGAW